MPPVDDALNAALKIICEASGAAYAIYWRLASTGGKQRLVVVADYTTNESRAVTLERGETGSFAEASRHVELDPLGKSVIATVNRTGQPQFVADARSTLFKRAGLAATYSIRSVQVIPFEQGALEYGTIDDRLADWQGRPPPIAPQIPSYQLRRSFDALGATYAVLWQRQGDVIRLVADYTTTSWQQLLHEARSDGNSFTSQSRGFELDANGQGPVATALRSRREVFVSNAPGSAMRRAQLASEYAIKRIHFTPMDGNYVLESGGPSSTPLGGSLLTALLKLYCDLSGASYSIYWVEDSGSHVVSRSYVTEAHAVNTAARGLQKSFPEATRKFQLPIGGDGPVATAAFTNLPCFVADASRSALRRAALMCTHGIRSIYTVPTEGGVFEFGIMEDGPMAKWPEMPWCPELPNAKLRAALDTGALYTIFWALDGNDYVVKADYVPPEERLHNRRNDGRSFVSESRGVRVPAHGDSPIAIASNTGRKVEVAPYKLTIRAALAEEFGITHLEFVPCDGGVLENAFARKRPQGNSGSGEAKATGATTETSARRVRRHTKEVMDAVLAPLTSALRRGARNSKEPVGEALTALPAEPMDSLDEQRSWLKHMMVAAENNDQLLTPSGPSFEPVTAKEVPSLGRAAPSREQSTGSFRKTVVTALMKSVGGAPTCETSAAANPPAPGETSAAYKRCEGIAAISGRMLSAHDEERLQHLASKTHKSLRKGSSAAKSARKARKVRSEQLEDFGDVLKYSFVRFDLDDLNGEIVRLRWGGSSCPPQQADETNEVGDASTLARARGNDVTVQLMRYDEGKTLRLTSHIEGKDNAVLDSPLRRLLQLDGSPFVAPLPLTTPDPVGQDIRDLPATLAKIQADWDQPTDSLNRMSAWTYTYLLRERMKAQDGNTHDGSIDLLITGCEVSLWIGEQFASDIHRVFPKLRVVTLSANKLCELPLSAPCPHSLWSLLSPTTHTALCASALTQILLAQTRAAWAVLPDPTDELLLPRRKLQSAQYPMPAGLALGRHFCHSRLFEPAQVVYFAHLCRHI